MSKAEAGNVQKALNDNANICMLNHVIPKIEIEEDRKYRCFGEVDLFIARERKEERITVAPLLCDEPQCNTRSSPLLPPSLAPPTSSALSHAHIHICSPTSFLSHNPGIRFTSVASSYRIFPQFYLIVWQFFIHVCESINTLIMSYRALLQHTVYKRK